MVTIPPGMENGNMLCIRGEGDAGPLGGPPGDLYIFLTVQEEEVLQEEINSEEAISYVDAMLRETLDTAIQDSVPAGTHQYRWHNVTMHP